MNMPVSKVRTISGSASVDRAVSIRRAMVPLGEIESDLTQNYLVKGWLDRGAFSVAYGASNVGKTFFALDISLHVAAGMSWHGARVGEPCPVIYVASEGGRGATRRLDAIWREMPDLARAASGNFQLLPMTLDICGQDTPALIEALQFLEDRPGLIVLDTLARSMGAGDENASQDMGAFIAAVDRLREETGAHVMVIHHSGKDVGKGARGWSGLKGAVDTELELTGEGEVITAEATKQRDMPKGTTFNYTLASVYLGDDQDGDAVTSRVVRPTEAPPPSKPKITGQAKIALQAFGDALAHHGTVRTGDMFPQNRQCVSLERWREYCDRLSLSSGETATAKRTAFFKSKAKLQEIGVICVVDDFAWRANE